MEVSTFSFHPFHLVLNRLPHYANWLLMACLGVPAANGSEQTQYPEGFIGIDNEVQELKEELLEINHELSLLERELFYPQERQLVVFVSMPRETHTRLHSIRIELDDKLIVEHEYTSLEGDALRRGGVHKPYVGTIDNGRHRLKAHITGRAAEGEQFQQSLTKQFVKGQGPNYIELRVSEEESGGIPTLTIHRW